MIAVLNCLKSEYFARVVVRAITGVTLTDGAGSVDFPQSQKFAATGLLNALLDTVDSLLGSSSGATFRDTGTMIDRIYGKTAAPPPGGLKGDYGFIVE